MTIDNSNIDSILARFFDGDTTCAEEQALQAYFAAAAADGSLPEHLKAYAPMFDWYAASMPGEPGSNITPAPAAGKRRHRVSPLVWWGAIAASLAIIVAAGWHRHAASVHENLLIRQYEGSYTAVNGIVSTDIADIRHDIDLTTLEALRIEKELDEACLQLDADMNLTTDNNKTNNRI